MSAVVQEKPPEVNAAPTSSAGEKSLLKRYRVSCADLRIGMFVAELDRPWLDTPFLIQGFQVGDDAELKSLRVHCRFVFVDVELSDPSVVEAIKAAELANAPPVEDEAPRSGSLQMLREAGAGGQAMRRPISRSTKARFRELMAPAPDDGQGSLPRRIARWFAALLGRRPSVAQLAERERRHRAELRRSLPADVKLRRYNDSRTVEEELPRATRAFDRGSTAIRNVVEDIRAGKSLEVAEVKGVVSDMVSSMISNPDALMWVARLREEDMNTYSHGVKVALYLIALGRHLGFPKEELAMLGMVGMLADVGKTKVPRALIDKPGMLAPSEFAIVKEHVRLGLDALRQTIKLSPEVEQGIAQHHERLDGTGYPAGLKGEEIGIYGRMAAIADSFAAMITPRAYANPTSPQDALINLFEWAGTSFHEPLVEQFVQAIGIFPVGSFVELSSGEAAIVLAHNRVRRLEPKVLLLTWPDKRPLSAPIVRNLFDRPLGTDGKPLRIVRGLSAGAYGLKVRDFYANDIAEANGLA